MRLFLGVLGSFVPFIGPFLALAAAFYVSVLGVKGAHETTTARAIISVAVPSILCFLLLAALIAAIFGFL